VTRSREARAEGVIDAEGVAHNAVEAGHRRALETIFGQVTVGRLAYRAKETPNLYVQDAALNLPAERHSHGLRERCAVESARGSFEEAQAAILRSTGQSLAKRQLEQLARRAASDFDSFYEQMQGPAVDEDDVLVISADGKGIVMRPEGLREATKKAAAAATHKLKTRRSKGEKRDRKRIAELAVVYDASPVVRTPADIMCPGGDGPKPPAPQAKAKWLTVSVVADASEVIAEAFVEADRRGIYELGASSFITKPATFSALVEVLRTWWRYWCELVELLATRGGRPKGSRFAATAPISRPFGKLSVEVTRLEFESQLDTLLSPVEDFHQHQCAFIAQGGLFVPYYQRHGALPPKRYTVLRRPTGEIYHEELLGTEGFIGESSALYHLHPPTRVARIEPLPAPDLKAWDGPLANLLFQPDRLSVGGDFITARVRLFFGEDVVYSVAQPDEESGDFYRNGVSDELIVIAEGSGDVLTPFGRLTYGQYDLVVIPRGVTSHWVPHGPQRLVIVETSAALAGPQRYYSPAGQLLDSAPYHERDVRSPILEEPVDREGEFPVLVKAVDRMGRYFFDRHPFDVVGWDGFFYPYALSMRDFEAISGSVHPLPDQYQILSADGVAISCLVPHPGASHPDASPAQAHHMNLDYDEILHRFATAPDSREPQGGTVTLHPRGLAHGPKPGYELAGPPGHLSTWGIMVDTRRPVRPTVAAMNVSDDGYAAVWL
jgi:homogentisate 1,2-dioxygenase